MKTAFAVIAIIVGCFGLLFLSNATTGVGLLALALLIAVGARIAQASDHHREVMKALADGRGWPPAARPLPPPPPIPPPDLSRR